MEAKYLAGDNDLKPNTYTYNAVISALAKSGETGAAARAERVLQNMVNRQRIGGSDAVKPTTIKYVAHCKQIEVSAQLLSHCCSFTVSTAFLTPGQSQAVAEQRRNEPKRFSNGWIGCTREATKT